MNQPPVHLMSPSDVFVAQFREAAGAAAEFEFRLRMIADKHPETSTYSLAHNLDDVERAVVGYFNAVGWLLPEEERTLRACRLVRNKLLHVELHAARARLVDAGAPQKDGGVIMGCFETGETVTVGDTTTSDGRVFEWLLECGQGGDFEEAELLFNRGIAIIRRLSLYESPSAGAGAISPLEMVLRLAGD
jgi:hypothetical protein